MGNNFREHAVFPDSSTDEVAVLSSEVKNKNRIVFCLHFARAHGYYLGFSLANLRLLPFFW